MESDWARADRLEKQLSKCVKNLDTCTDTAVWLLIFFFGSNALWFVLAVLPHLRWQ